jgi:hypothetical protein
MDAASVRIGDIIVFRRENALIAHRVISIRNEEKDLTFVVKGDYASTCDPLLKCTDLLGRVTFVRRGSHIADLDTPRFRLMAVVFAFLSAHTELGNTTRILAASSRWVRARMEAVYRKLACWLTGSLCCCRLRL